MRKAGVRVLLSCLSFAVLSACGGSPQPERGTDLPTTDLEVVSPDDPPLPETSGVLKFAVVGDSGRWSQEQRELARQLAAQHERFPFDFVLMLGDNNYGDGSPQSFKVRFEEPYQPLLEAGVKFYATLGNHDDPAQRFYKPFNMDGQRFYTFEKGGVRFFALDSNYMDQTQVDWLEKELSVAKNTWKIAFFHHPLYSSGQRHGSEIDLRSTLEPLFLKYGISVVFSGHEHFYERLLPQKGITYFTNGGGAKLREGNIRVGSSMTAKGFDTDRSYMPRPAKATFLYGLEVPTVGGDTLFANATMAYDALPDDVRNRIDKLNAIHWVEHSRRTGGVALATEDELKKAPPVRHPLARPHPATGRKAIYCGCHAWITVTRMLCATWGS